MAEGATVTRIDSKPVTDFASGLKAYKHTDDWSQSGLDTGDDSYWKNKNLKTNTTKGLFAGDFSGNFALNEETLPGPE